MTRWEYVVSYFVSTVPYACDKRASMGVPVVAVNMSTIATCRYHMLFLAASMYKYSHLKHLIADDDSNDATLPYTLHNAYCTAQVPWARHHSYRPFTILSFKWTHNLGGLVPWYYHAGNIAVNAANVVLVQRVSTLCLRGFKHPQRIASGCAALFACHPVYVDSTLRLCVSVRVCDFLSLPQNARFFYFFFPVCFYPFFSVAAELVCTAIVFVLKAGCSPHSAKQKNKNLMKKKGTSRLWLGL